MGKTEKRKTSPAQERAKKSALKTYGKVEKITTPVTTGLTTFSEIKSKYRTAIVITPGNDPEQPDGWKFMIQSIVPGNFIVALDTPVLNMLVDKGTDFSDPLDIKEKIESIPDEDKIKLVNDKSFDDMMKDVVIAGVISMKLVRKAQIFCTEEDEVSIDLIPKEDLNLLYQEIMKLSVPKELADKFFSTEGTIKEETN